MLMNYKIKIFKKNNRKYLFAEKELKEDEWKGNELIDVKLDKFNIAQYFKSSETYPLTIIVKIVKFYLFFNYF
jgi:hypothetical protein